MCSTPDGINGKRVLTAGIDTQDDCGAQRLTASTENAHGASHYGAWCLLCSTPDGINGKRTPMLSTPPAHCRVLNA